MDNMQRVLSYFREICSIPRRSGDESNVAQYLIETGKRLGLEVDQDSCGNVVLRKAISQTSLDKGTQRKTTENELPSLTQCTA